jgi:hypothetical protein
MKSKQIIKITAQKFKSAIKSDPAWALTLTEPVEITGYCDMDGSAISHLSPLLHFRGRSAKGDAASFSYCKNLKMAEGTFNGFACFLESGVEKIGNLEITAPNKNGAAACFCRCNALTVAEGTFPGSVCFPESGITRVGELNINAPNKKGIKADFSGCDLRVPAEFLGPEYIMDKSTRQEALSRIASAKALRVSPEIEI